MKGFNLATGGAGSNVVGGRVGGILAPGSAAGSTGTE